MSTQPTDIVLGEPIPEAGLVPVRIVDEQTSSRSAYIKVLVEYLCCGRQKIVTIDNIRRRRRSGSQICRACQCARMGVEIGVGRGVSADGAWGRMPKAGYPDYGVTPPGWIPPPSVTGPKNRHYWQPAPRKRGQGKIT